MHTMIWIHLFHDEYVFDLKGCLTAVFLGLIVYRVQSNTVLVLMLRKKKQQPIFHIIYLYSALSLLW